MSAVPRDEAAALLFDIDVPGGSCEGLGRWRIMAWIQPEGSGGRRSLPPAASLTGLVRMVRLHISLLSIYTVGLSFKLLTVFRTGRVVERTSKLMVAMSASHCTYQSHRQTMLKPRADRR
jgi:hypothetical protein